MEAFSRLSDLALLLGLSTVRLAVAFLLLPMFTQESLPALVRNSLFVGIGVITLAMQPTAVPPGLDVGSWVGLFAKEAFIGAVIGFFASSLLWAVESAGQLIDAKSGASLGAMVDPFSGNQSSNTGVLLARIGSWVFMASGGFMFLVGVLLESYVAWPVTSALPALRPEAVSSFEGALGRIMLLMLMLAGPVLVVLYVIDAALGLVNRYAPSINLLTIAPPVKSLLALGVVMVLLGSIIDLMVVEFTQKLPAILGVVRSLFAP